MDWLAEQVHRLGYGISTKLDSWRGYETVSYEQAQENNREFFQQYSQDKYWSEYDKKIKEKYGLTSSSPPVTAPPDEENGDVGSKTILMMVVGLIVLILSSK